MYHQQKYNKVIFFQENLTAERYPDFLNLELGTALTVIFPNYVDPYRPIETL